MRSGKGHMTHYIQHSPSILMPTTATKGKCNRSQRANASEKSHIQNPLGLVKNHQTPKTFNKDKKVVRGKEYPSTGKGSQKYP
jgi:hypothetical protein